MVDGIAESIDGYENLSYVNSPEDPAPANPVCEPTAISSGLVGCGDGRFRNADEQCGV